MSPNIIRSLAGFSQTVGGCVCGWEDEMVGGGSGRVGSGGGEGRGSWEERGWFWRERND